ncbi:hypothetical protein IJ384_07285 [bacterium]|nr:hypothetical protein [bacterium]
MSNFKVGGRFLDQPLLVAKFQKKVPYILAGGGLAYTAHCVKKSDAEKKNETLLRVGTTMMFTVLSALAAPKIVNKIFKNPAQSIKQIKKNNKEIIDNYLKEKKVDNKTEIILNKAKDKVLSIKQIKHLDKNTDKEFINKLIPEPENISSKEIFSEIGRLSLLGLIPVLGGISGGIAGDMVVSRDWKKNLPNKIKEGTYQYLANIFLCNVGAGIALGIMEKMGVKGKVSRALGMVAGIVAMGIVGGSAIANAIGNKIINPMLGEQQKKGIYSERKPEALDIGLHVDDIATVAVMSGLKWIEPALPIMYSISGYRAGIGYRNVNVCNKKNVC